MTSDDAQWYRLLKDTGIAERLGRLQDFTVVRLSGTNSFTTRLYISNARRSYTGYYWVRSPFDDVCNASLTVTPSKQLHPYMDIFICSTYVQYLLYRCYHS